eukprot:CAMPEP_0184549790 /NCGR_PEP_ID=MMETSP0199_2-20130426/12307_1 /TAXON_ID=1112570 /ORGANISM="Thraustochytrium sp., Strain LLF1b" /LENGTH=301 /DNA_ID=CAMNT_0026944537 /DNA_START=144 /DNA_END=1049 /DNA_ORIENTATION=+
MTKSNRRRASPNAIASDGVASASELACNPEKLLERSKLLDKRLWPRLTDGHLALSVMMISFMLLGSAVFPMIDHDTLKPSDEMPAWLKTVSHYSNIPVKLGAIHLVLYAAEMMVDQDLAERHMGQRMTTMWMQTIEHPRWGQHFHMQLEAVLQIADLLKRKRKGETSQFPSFLHVLLGVFAFIMVVTNFVTSCCYHTLSEQVIGAVLACVKLVGFDYWQDMENINVKVGQAYTPITIPAAACTFFAVSSIVSAISSHDSVSSMLFVHPTGQASFFWAISWLTKYALDNLNNRPSQSPATMR